MNLLNSKLLERQLESTILDTDGYKASQYLQYPAGTRTIFSYGESRGSKKHSKYVAYGMGYFVQKYLSKPITQENIDFASSFMAKYGAPFNKDGWQYILDTYKGYLPLKIKGVKEGTVMPLRQVLYTVENTDPECFWLTSYIETALLRAVWYPGTVASNSLYCRDIILKYLKETSMNDTVQDSLFMLHDFGARGVSSKESADIGGSAHLLPFRGTDTVSAVVTAMKYYDTDVCGFTIPASEHSTMTSFGRDNEMKAYSNMVAQFAKKDSVFACVIDSYNIWDAIEKYWVQGGLLDRVKKAGARVVLRPDSGDPLRVPIKVIEMLAEHVGYTVNDKGYKVLPEHVRVIQGDGITKDTIPLILENLKVAGFSAENLAFGMGGGLLQQVNRDDFKMAMKASAGNINSEWVDIFKDPVTDPGKVSKKGRLTLVSDGKGNYRTIDVHDPIEPNEESVMITYYNNGIRKDALDNFDTIRERFEETNKLL